MANLKPPVNEKDHIKGTLHAPVILVEYGDFQCPHCGAAHPILKEIEKIYKDRLAFIFRHFPLAEYHPYAQMAAVASEAAANQGKFWQMHDLIFENQESLSPQTLLILAKGLKLDMNTFEKDIKDPKLFEKVEANFESGVISGVNGTPSFYINSMKFNGSYDFQSLTHAIDKELSEHAMKQSIKDN
jgi:protein-disulfide isomerase